MIRLLFFFLRETQQHDSWFVVECRIAYLAFIEFDTENDCQASNSFLVDEFGLENGMEG